MKSHLNTNLWAGILVALLWLRPASVAAQPVNYNYDSAGNLISVSASGSTQPVITVSPQAQLLQSNSLATFSVSASGVGLSYQWLSNGIPILGANGDSLILGNLPLTGTNLGNFSVIVSNASGSVTSTPAALWPDANGNDIPDWWEMKYFGNLNQTALGDYDGDGVDNLDEYLEGTNPADKTSFNPRLIVQASHGYVTVAPSLPYYAKGQLVTLTAVPDPGQGFVKWSGAVSGTKPTISLFMNTNQSVTANFGFPLAVALDNTNLVWTTGGDALWFGQAEVSMDGIGSAQSGPIVSIWNGSTFVGQQTWLQTVVDTSQTMLLSFWWNASSRPPNALSFGVDGALLASISGESPGWQNIQTNLSSGHHTLTWTYSKGPVDIPTGVPFVDRGWVDQVTLTATTTPPPAPLLSITLTATNTVLVSWPVSTATFVLQQNAVVGTTGWINATNAITVSSGQYQAIITPEDGGQLYRLKFP